MHNVFRQQFAVFFHLQGALARKRLMSSPHKALRIASHVFFLIVPSVVTNSSSPNLVDGTGRKIRYSGVGKRDGRGIGYNEVKSEVGLQEEDCCGPSRRILAVARADTSQVVFHCPTPRYTDNHVPIPNTPQLFAALQPMYPPPPDPSFAAFLPSLTSMLSRRV